MIPFEQTRQIILPYPDWQEILEHCKRKLAENYLHGESRERKAYGLVAGVENGHILNVRRIFPFKKNRVIVVKQQLPQPLSNSKHR